MSSTTWRPTLAQTLNPPSPGTDPEYDRQIIEWRERKRAEAAAIEPPPLLDVAKYPDVAADPEFEPAPADWRPSS